MDLNQSCNDLQILKLEYELELSKCEREQVIYSKIPNSGVFYFEITFYKLKIKEIEEAIENIFIQLQN